MVNKTGSGANLKKQNKKETKPLNLLSSLFSGGHITAESWQIESALNESCCTYLKNAAFAKTLSAFYFEANKTKGIQKCIQTTAPYAAKYQCGFSENVWYCYKSNFGTKCDMNRSIPIKLRLNVRQL